MSLRMIYLVDVQLWSTEQVLINVFLVVLTFWSLGSIINCIDNNLSLDFFSWIYQKKVQNSNNFWINWMCYIPTKPVSFNWERYLQDIRFQLQKASEQILGRSAQNWRKWNIEKGSSMHTRLFINQRACLCVKHSEKILQGWQENKLSLRNCVFNWWNLVELILHHHQSRTKFHQLIKIFLNDSLFSFQPCLSFSECLKQTRPLVDVDVWKWRISKGL